MRTRSAQGYTVRMLKAEYGANENHCRRLPVVVILLYNCYKGSDFCAVENREKLLLRKYRTKRRKVIPHALVNMLK